MQDLQFSGKWNGFYEYGAKYTAKKGQRVAFWMEISVTDGILQGKAYEDVTETLMEGEPAVVEGFIDGSMLSMVKRYRWMYYLDKHGVLVVDKKAKPHAIHYTGYYDAGKGVFAGDWDIERGGSSPFAWRAAVGIERGMGDG